jgi:Mg2+-importing ATPase
MILPFTPLANVLGFAPLPAEFFGLLAGLMVVYLVLVEIVKRWFYRRLAQA